MINVYEYVGRRACLTDVERHVLFGQPTQCSAFLASGVLDFDFELFENILGAGLKLSELDSTCLFMDRLG